MMLQGYFTGVLFDTGEETIYSERKLLNCFPPFLQFSNRQKHSNRDSCREMVVVVVVYHVL